MIEKIDPWVRGKKILLLGFGREGKSTWEVLRRLGTFQSVDIADQSAPGELPEGIGKWISGPDYQSCLNDYDVVFKSPGVVLESRCRITAVRSFPRQRCFSGASAIRLSVSRAPRERVRLPRCCIICSNMQDTIRFWQEISEFPCSILWKRSYRKQRLCVSFPAISWNT